MGQLTAIAQPRTFELVLTDRRLLFADPSAVQRNGLDTVALALELSGLRTRPYPGPSLNKRFDLEADDMPPLRLNFPLSGRSDAEAIRAPSTTVARASPKRFTGAGRWSGGGGRASLAVSGTAADDRGRD